MQNFEQETSRREKVWKRHTRRIWILTHMWIGMRWLRTRPTHNEKHILFG
jgi:hypothetical protein